MFGNCQKGSGLKDTYQYELNSKSLQALEAKTWDLVNEGYSWKDPYTQCVLQNALFGYRYQQSPRYEICQVTDETSKDVKNEIASVLERLFQKYYSELQDPSSIQDSMLDYPSKRDEIVYVHKYFDKSPKPYTKKNFLSPYQKSDYLGNDFYYDKTPDSRISLEDIQKLQRYFQDLDDYERVSESAYSQPNNSPFDVDSLRYEDDLGINQGAVYMYI